MVTQNNDLNWEKRIPSGGSIAYVTSCCGLMWEKWSKEYKKATFSAEEIHLMRTTINRLRNERLSKGQYTDAADDMLLKLF